ncbi:hypothetical protein [Actinoplanes sp. NPDC049265]|uniref:hypothetical protein n=1 Tax=Actinoplanes sp. NPDC049265 TaxID=3363902 RepID=UPI0037237FFF
MSDAVWNSPQALEAGADGIRAEGSKWYGFSDQMAAVAGAMAEMTLAPTAFTVIDASGVGAMTAGDQGAAYDRTQMWLTSLFTEASAKFEELGDALKKCATDYERTDGNVARSFDAIAKGLK